MAKVKKKFGHTKNPLQGSANYIARDMRISTWDFRARRGVLTLLWHIEIVIRPGRKLKFHSSHIMSFVLLHSNKMINFLCNLLNI
jgi:hypothetical protein